MSYPLDDAFMKLWYFLFLLFFSMPRSLVRRLVYSYKKVNLSALQELGLHCHLNSYCQCPW